MRAAVLHSPGDIRLEEVPVPADVSKEKLAMATEAGATHAALAGEPLGKNLWCDVVIEAVGHPSSVNQAAQLAGAGGRGSFVGIPVGDVNLSDAAFQHFLRQEVSLHGSWNSFGSPFPGDQWTVTLDKLASGDLRRKFIISHDLDLAELPRMSQAFKDRSTFFSKVMFQP